MADLPPNMLIQELSALMGSGDLIGDPGEMARYRTDWSGDLSGLPLVVVRPSSTEEVSRVLSFCNERGVKVIPHGGHTGLVGGATATDGAGEILLSLERMNAIGPLDRDNYSVTVEAGVVLHTLREAMEREGFCFPLALGSEGSCQIGGNIATNAGGLNVLRYGMMRELVLGLEVVLPDGRVWNGMHALRKDNTGFDIKQLFLGSEGTLGVVTRAVLKLFPAPSQIETALVSLETVEDVVRLFGVARRELCDLLSAFELLTHDGAARTSLSLPLEVPGPYYVILEVSTSGIVNARDLLEAFLADALEAGAITGGTLASSHAQAAKIWAVREEIIEFQVRRGRHLRTDISVPISELSGFVAEAGAAVAALDEEAVVLVYGHVGDGNLHFNVVPPERFSEAERIAFLARCEDAIFEAVDAHAGSISAEHGIGRLKRAAFLARIDEVELDLISRIKDAFDRGGTLNPGRILEARGL